MTTLEVPNTTWYTQCLAARLESVAAARRFCRDVLCRYGLDSQGDTAELLVSELVTNAVVHAGHSAAVFVQVACGDRVIRVEVNDESPALPVVCEADPLAERGRGLMLVATLASRWGVEAGDPWKTVWFELDVDY